MNSFVRWIKTNWLAVALVALIVLAAFFAWKWYNASTVYDKLMEQYTAQAKSFKEDIVKLEKINEEEKKKNSALEESYKKDLTKIENDYQNKINDLSKKSVTNRKKIVVDAKKDPTSLTAKVTQVFGIPTYVIEGKSK
jgi:predicted PurR-regulated permease PerM